MLVSCAGFASALLVGERNGRTQKSALVSRAIECNGLLRIVDEGFDSASFSPSPAIQRASRSSFPAGLAGGDLEWAKRLACRWMTPAFSVSNSRLARRVTWLPVCKGLSTCPFRRLHGGKSAAAT